MVISRLLWTPEIFLASTLTRKTNLGPIIDFEVCGMWSMMEQGAYGGIWGRYIYRSDVCTCERVRILMKDV